VTSGRQLPIVQAGPTLAALPWPPANGTGPRVQKRLERLAVLLKLLELLAGAEGDERLSLRMLVSTEVPTTRPGIQVVQVRSLRCAPTT
jgi:hypothetical protein